MLSNQRNVKFLQNYARGCACKYPVFCFFTCFKFQIRLLSSEKED